MSVFTVIPVHHLIISQAH